MPSEKPIEQLAAEQGPRWPSRKDAWLDGYREGAQHARMTGTAAISREDHLAALGEARRKGSRVGYAAMLERAQDAEDRCLRVEADHDQTGALMVAYKERAEKLEAQLQTLRADVRRQMQYARNLAAATGSERAAEHLTAVADGLAAALPGMEEQ